MLLRPPPPTRSPGPGPFSAVRSPSQTTGPCGMDSSKVEVATRARLLFIMPCSSLRRGRRPGCCCYGCCSEKSKGSGGKRKSPDQGAVVTMATVSAPAPLKLGEGVGLLPPSIPPTLTATSSCEAQDPELCPLEEASEHRGAVPSPSQLEGSPQELAEKPAQVEQGLSSNRTCHAPKAFALLLLGCGWPWAHPSFPGSGFHGL